MKNRDYLINMYHASSTEDSKGEIETYEAWLERQLLYRIEKLDELDFKELYRLVMRGTELFFQCSNGYMIHRIWPCTIQKAEWISTVIGIELIIQIPSGDK